MAKIILEQTCFGCPEQYDVFNGEELIGYIPDDCSIHTVCCSAELRVLYDHGFQRCVAGAFADSQKRAVDAGSAVEPGEGGVCYSLIEIVVAVPLDKRAWEAAVYVKTVDYAGD